MSWEQQQTEKLEMATEEVFKNWEQWLKTKKEEKKGLHKKDACTSEKVPATLWGATL